MENSIRAAVGRVDKTIALFDVKTIDRELVDLRDLEKSNKAAAVAVAGNTQEAATTARSGVRVENVKRNLPPGIMLARYTIAKAISFKEMVPASLEK